MSANSDRTRGKPERTQLERVYPSGNTRTSPQPDLLTGIMWHRWRSRRRLFPGTLLHKGPPQRLAARQQTVVRVRKRKQRKKCEGLPATGATTATDPDPIVVFIVRLLAAASVADDRIAFTSGAAPQDDFGVAHGPIRFELVRRDGKWDKQNRSSSGLCSDGVDPSRSKPEAELLPPEAKNPTEREYSFSAVAI